MTEINRTAGLYVRISRDSEAEGLGVARQEADCQKLATARGWDVSVPVYSDNDISATSGRRRPGWERLLKDLETGRINAVVAYSSSRMYRRPADLGRLVTLTKARSIEIATVASGSINLDTVDGRMLAGILAEIDQAEAERTGERVKRAKLQRRESGRHNGGGRRPFGYRREPGNGLVVVKPEAKLIREAAKRVIDGDLPGRIVSDWNERGVVTAEGGRWRPDHLKRILVGKQPKLREKPLVAGGTDWPAILDATTLADVKARIMVPSKYAPKEPVNGRKYAWTGLLKCYACGSNMLGSGGYYRCALINGGCGSVSVKAADIEDMLDALVLDRVATVGEPDIDRRPPSATRRAELEAELAATEARRADLAQAFASGTVDAAAYGAAAALVLADVDRLTVELADTLPDPEPIAYAAIMSPEQRRAAGRVLTANEVADIHEAYATVVESVTVKPRVGKPKTLDTKRIKVRWK